MRKKYIGRTVKIVSLVLAVVLSVLLLSDTVLRRTDHNRERIEGFYLEDPDSIDVAFVGASEVYCDIAPGYLYGRFGFTSYPVATTSCTILNYKSMIRETVRTQHPKLIVVEINGATYDDFELDKEVNVRYYADNIPLNENKTELVRKAATQDEIEYYVPFIKYHSTWKDFPDGVRTLISIFQNRFRGYNLLKGVKNITEFYVPTTPDMKIRNAAMKGNTERAPLNETCEKELRELLQYCKDEKLNVVFTRFPHLIIPKTVNRYKRSNTIGDIVAEYGFDYINLENSPELMGLDLKKDFYNQDHLNIYGQLKFDRYFGQYLVDHYGIGPSALTPAQQEEWDEAARWYDAYKFYNFYLFENRVKKEVRENAKTMQYLEQYLDPDDRFDR